VRKLGFWIDDPILKIKNFNYFRVCKGEMTYSYPITTKRQRVICPYR